MGHQLGQQSDPPSASPSTASSSCWPASFLESSPSCSPSLSSLSSAGASPRSSAVCSSPFALTSASPPRSSRLHRHHHRVVTLQLPHRPRPAHHLLASGPRRHRHRHLRIRRLLFRGLPLLHLPSPLRRSHRRSRPHPARRHLARPLPRPLRSHRSVNAQLQYARFLSLGIKWLVLVLSAAMALDHLNIGGTVVALAFGILSAASSSPSPSPSVLAPATSSAAPSKRP